MVRVSSGAVGGAFADVTSAVASVATSLATVVTSGAGMQPCKLNLRQANGIDISYVPTHSRLLYHMNK
jgi:hypothetical protein